MLSGATCTHIAHRGTATLHVCCSLGTVSKAVACNCLEDEVGDIELTHDNKGSAKVSLNFTPFQIMSIKVYLDQL